jgi:transcriptional regulator with XRE-family HTH domain
MIFDGYLQHEKIVIIVIHQRGARMISEETTERTMTTRKEGRPPGKKRTDWGELVQVCLDTLHMDQYDMAARLGITQTTVSSLLSSQTVTRKTVVRFWTAIVEEARQQNLLYLFGPLSETVFFNIAGSATDEQAQAALRTRVHWEKQQIYLHDLLAERDKQIMELERELKKAKDRARKRPVAQDVIPAEG